MTGYILIIALIIMFLAAAVYAITYYKHCKTVESNYDEHWDFEKYKYICSIMEVIILVSLVVVITIIATNI